MSKRLDILKKLTEVLEGITPDNGFSHDLKGKVFRGRDRFGSNFSKHLPMLSILEAKGAEYGNFADEEELTRFDDWVLLIQGWTKDDPRNPTDPAYELVADVEKRLSMVMELDKGGYPVYQGVYRLSGLIAKLTVAQPVVRPPEEGLSDTAFFFLPIRVGIKTDLRNP